MHIPQSCYVYEFSYPEGMPELAGIIFYVGKGTGLSRMNMHLNEAASGCDCAKCDAIRSIWDAGLVVVRRIVFESSSERDALDEEKRRILQHRSPHLTNVQHAGKVRNLAPIRVAEKAVVSNVPMSRAMHNRAIISTSGAMELSGLSRAHLQRLLRAGRVEGFKPGHDWFVYEDSLKAFLEQPRIPGPKGPGKSEISSLPSSPPLIPENEQVAETSQDAENS